MGVISTTHIKAGEEIFTYYGYGPGTDEDFPWYWELKQKVEDEEELRTNKS